MHRIVERRRAYIHFRDRKHHVKVSISSDRASRNVGFAKGAPANSGVTSVMRAGALGCAMAFFNDVMCRSNAEWKTHSD